MSYWSSVKICTLTPNWHQLLPLDLCLRYDHNLVMKSVSVAKLKSNLSQYLNVVKKGTEIIVTSHRHPVARLTPLAKENTAIEIIAARMPVSSLKKIRGIKLETDPVTYLLADRRRR